MPGAVVFAAVQASTPWMIVAWYLLAFFGTLRS